MWSRPAVCTGTTSEWPPEAQRPGIPGSRPVRSRGMARFRTTKIESAESGDERPRRWLPAEVTNDPESRATSYSPICLGPRGPSLTGISFRDGQPQVRCYRARNGPHC